MATRKRNKKTYKELIEEISMLTSMVQYYRDHLERLGILVESYIHMNGDEDKLIKHIEKRSKEVKEKWNERK